MTDRQGGVSEWSLYKSGDGEEKVAIHHSLGVERLRVGTAEDRYAAARILDRLKVQDGPMRQDLEKALLGIEVHQRHCCPHSWESLEGAWFGIEQVRTWLHTPTEVFNSQAESVYVGNAGAWLVFVLADD